MIGSHNYESMIISSSLDRVMAVPATVIYFTTYEQLKAALGHSYTSVESNWWKPIVAGASSRGKQM